MTWLQIAVCLLLTVLYVAVVVYGMLTKSYELAGIMTPVILLPVGFLFGKGLLNVTVSRNDEKP